MWNVRCIVQGFSLIILHRVGVYSSLSVLCRPAVLRWDNGGIFQFNESIVIVSRWFIYSINSMPHIQIEGQCRCLCLCVLYVCALLLYTSFVKGYIIGCVNLPIKKMSLKEHSVFFSKEAINFVLQTHKMSSPHAL